MRWQTWTLCQMRRSSTRSQQPSPILLGLAATTLWSYLAPSRDEHSSMSSVSCVESGFLKMFCGGVGVT